MPQLKGAKDSVNLFNDYEDWRASAVEGEIDISMLGGAGGGDDDGGGGNFDLGKQ